MNYVAFNATSVGQSHIKKSIECQDYSQSFRSDEFAIAVVCDGHGGYDYIRSAVGSEIAANAAMEMIKEFIRSIPTATSAEEFDSQLVQLEKSIIALWGERVKQHFAENPLLVKELKGVSEQARVDYENEENIETIYGTTIIAVAVTQEYWFGIHIGDGKCVVKLHNGTFCEPIPWDDRCFLNYCTSLCSSTAISDFRHYFSKELPAAIFIGTDGVDDSFGTPEQLYHFYDVVLYSAYQDGLEKCITDLNDYLPELSAGGSGDDISVAVILDIETLESYVNLDALEQHNVNNDEESAEDEDGEDKPGSTQSEPANEEETNEESTASKEEIANK